MENNNFDQKYEENIVYGDPISDDYMEGCRSFGEYILKKLSEYGDNVLLVDGITYEETTAAQLRFRSIRFAKSLQQSGIKKGDVIFVSCEDKMEFAYILFGAMYLGACVTFVEPNYNEEQMSHTIDETKPKIIFSSYTSIENIRKIAKARTFIEKVILFGDNWDGDSVIACAQWLGGICFDKCNKWIESNTDEFDCMPVDMKDTISIILRTSGTTSLPKSILVTQTNLMLSSILYKQHHLTPNPIAFSIVPWVRGIGVKMLFKYVLNNVKFVFIHRATDLDFLRVVEKYSINIAWIHTNTMILLGENPISNSYDLSSLRILFTGGAPLPTELRNAVKKRLPLAITRLIYGMVELSYVIHQTDDHCKLGSVGVLQRGILGKVVDVETGKTLCSNKEGELCFKGDVVMKGYIGDETLNYVIDGNGWFHSGDIGYYDEERNWFLVGRIKDLIHINDRKVLPIDIERLLLEYPKVSDAAVIGIPNENGCGDVAVAFIVKNAEIDVCTEEEIINVVATKTIPEIRLQRVIFIKKLPKTIIGKLLRTYLRKFCSKNPIEANDVVSPFYLRWYNNNKID